jgi:hypothetical protein
MWGVAVTRIGGFERRLSLQTWIFGILTDIVPSLRDPTIQDNANAAIKRFII